MTATRAAETVKGFRRDTMRRAGTDDEWWQQRAPFVGASTAAVLFGEHPFITRAQLAEQRRTRERTPDNKAMARGRFLEAAVAEWWAVEHGVDITEAEQLYLVNGVVVATLDRLIVGQPAALEVKTTRNRVHDVERYWWWQAQAQLAATGFERIEFAVLDGTLTLQSFTVEPDTDAMIAVVVEARAFIDAVNAGETFTNPQPSPNALELDAHARSLIKAWRFAQARADELSSDIQMIKGMVERALGAFDSGTINGTEVVRRVHRKGSRLIDGTRLRAEHPDIAEEYTRIGNPSSSVVLR